MDIKMPDLKTVAARLSALRNYLNLVVPLIIAVVAVLMFIPTALLSNGLKQKIQTQSLSKGRTLDALAGASLSSRQYQEERKYQQAYAQDANQIERLARETTERELLSTQIFPKPKDTSPLIYEEFGKRYLAGIEQRIAQVRGHDAPSDAELTEHLQSVQGQSPLTNPRGGMGMGMGMMMPGRSSMPAASGRPQGSGAVGPYGYGMVNPLVEQIMEAVCHEKAQSSGLYVSPTDVAGYAFWTKWSYSDKDPAITDCWYWQLGYWIIQDVFDTISACNDGSRNVFEASVKRLIRVGFDRSMTGMGAYAYAARARGASQDSAAAEEKPKYVVNSFEGLTQSCTGRLSNGEIHVIQFDVTVVVRADRVMDFMQNLCSAKTHPFAGFDANQPPQVFKHNQITILESSARAVDRGGASMTGAAAMYGYGGRGMAMGRGMGPGMGRGMGMTATSHDLHRYGQEAVVELDLICEYLFEKAGYEPIVPESVKKLFESPDGAANTTN